MIAAVLAYRTFVSLHSFDFYMYHLQSCVLVIFQWHVIAFSQVQKIGLGHHFLVAHFFPSSGVLVFSKFCFVWTSNFVLTLVAVLGRR